MAIDKRVGFIGAGNMGLAMMARIVKKNGGESVLYWDKSPEQNRKAEERTGLPPAESLALLIKESQFIVCAVKPQHMFGLLEGMRDMIRPGHIFITIAPGIAISEYQAFLHCPVVRAMPNIAALVGESMSVLAFSKDFTSENDRAFVTGLFDAIGKTVVFEERLIDSAIPVSGSSPAYVFMLIDAMADAGVRLGIPRDMAKSMAAQSIIGSAALYIETGEHPGELKDKVCSPGGTTIEAVAVLERLGFRSAVIEAMNACYEKTKSIRK